MNWKFWKKDISGGGSGQSTNKLPRPKDLPQELGRHLVVDEGIDPDRVWNWKCVMCSRDGSSTLFKFRIFSEAAAADNNVRVRDYTSLDAHEDLILYEGWFDRKSRQFNFEKAIQQAE